MSLRKCQRRFTRIAGRRSTGIWVSRHQKRCCKQYWQSWFDFRKIVGYCCSRVGEFVATFAAGAAASLGAYIIPFGRSSVASGTLPGYPGLTYHYDGDMGHFSLYNSDNELLFTGTTGGDGLIRTADGDVIGRRIDGSVILDSTIIPVGPKDKTKSSAQPGAQSQSIATTVPPNLCPDPSPDRPGFKSARSIAYQQYISTLINPDHPIPPGWAVNFTNPTTGQIVSFDDCYHHTGDPTDAKGPGISDMVQNEKMAAYLTISYQNQAERQIGAAPGHRIDWYVDEPQAAAFFRKVFSSAKYSNISIIDMTMFVVKLFFV